MFFAIRTHAKHLSIYCVVVFLFRTDLGAGILRGVNAVRGGLIRFLAPCPVAEGYRAMIIHFAEAGDVRRNAYHAHVVRLTCFHSFTAELSRQCSRQLCGSIPRYCSRIRACTRTS